MTHQSVIYSSLKQFKHLFFITSTLMATTGIAQELEELSIEDLFDVKVMELASGVEQQVNKAPAVVSVITAEEISAYGATSVHEALEMVPGLHVVPSSVANMWPVVTFRGIFGDTNPQVLWLMDGKRISYTIHGGFDMNFFIPIGNVKKIEVIRGPASALYGAEAFAGVVNVITYDSSDGNEVAVQLGSFDRKGFSARGGFALSPLWRIGYQAEYNERGNDTSRVITADTQTLFDSLFGTNASLAPAPLVDAMDQTSLSLKLEHEKWNLTSHYLAIDSPQMTGTGNALSEDDTRKNTIFSQVVEYRSNMQDSQWQFQPSFHYLKAELETKLSLFPSGTEVPVGSDGNIDFAAPVSTVEFSDGYLGYPASTYEVMEIDVPIYQQGIKQHQIRYNIGYRYEKSKQSELKNFGPGVIDGSQPVVDISYLTDVTGTDFIYLDDLSRNVFHISVQDIWKINDSLEATLGLRFDDYSDVGSTLTPRATLIWEASNALTAKFIYGEAFRAPSFMERGVRNNPATLGNPNLDNETLDSFEVSLSYIVNRDIWLNLNLYQYQAKQLIQYVPNVGQTSSTAQNINEYEGEGLELELFWQPSNAFELSLNYALQSTENDIAKQQQPFVPQQMLMLRTNWILNDQWQANFSVRGVLDRDRELADQRPDVDDYWLCNFNLQYRVGNITFSGTIKNLFNQDLREPSSVSSNIPDDYPLNERHGFIEATWRF